MDNLLDLKRNVDVAIPINGGVASVKTSNHNPLEKNIIDKVGRYTGFPYKVNARLSNNLVPSGSFYWQGNSMNTQSDFEIIISKKTLDGNAIDEIIRFLRTGDLIHYKDSKGDSVVLKYKAHSFSVDNNNNEFLRLIVSSSVNNPAVIFTNDSNYDTNCFLEFITFASDSSSDRIYRNYIDVNSEMTSIITIVDSKNNSFKIYTDRDDNKIDGVAQVEYFDGETIKIKNDSESYNLRLIHSSGETPFTFYFKDKSDYILRPKEVLLFTLDNEERVFNAHTNYESSLLQRSQVFNVTQSMYSADANFVRLQLAEMPNELGLSVYLRGVLQSPDTYSINGNTIEINNNLIPTTINHNDIIVVTYTLR